MTAPRPTYSGVVATLALFLALGGTGYAALKLPRNSVGTREVRDHSLLPADLARGTALSGPRGPRGAEGVAGPVGPAGPAGAQGSQGAAGVSSVVTISKNVIQMTASGPSATDIASLVHVPAGKWWVIGSVSLVWSGNAGSDFFRCSLAFGGAGGHASSVARLGTDPGSALATDMVVHEARTLIDQSNITLRCGHDTSIGGGNPRVDHAQLTAIRADAVDVQGQ